MACTVPDKTLTDAGGDDQDVTLTVTTSGDSTGTVTSLPAGIDCGASCTVTVPSGTTITLTATPEGDAVFTGWSGGGCSGTGDCDVTLTEDTTVDAAFDTEPVAPVAAVIVTPATASVVVNGTRQLSAETRDAEGNVLTGRPITWTSNDTTVATVSATGLVTGVAPGPATITATSEGVDGTAAITVSAIPVASVEVTPPTASVQEDSTVQLTATVRDADGNILTGRPITWTSSNTAVATVNATGLVTGVGAGPATITATCEGQSDTAAITVTLIPVATVEVLPATASILVDGTVQLTATLRDADGNVLTGRPITWTSNNTAAATVSATGLVTGEGGGTATITATSEGQSDTAVITVEALDTRIGYVWADQPSSASYTPSTSYSRNSTGGAITITRSGVGTYSVTFAGLGRNSVATAKDTVAVTAYGGGDTRCRVTGWDSFSVNFVANVRCATHAGTAVDSYYNVLVMGADAVPGRLGFAWNDVPGTGGTPSAAYSHNSAAGAMNIVRNSVGNYTVNFNGLGRIGPNDRETIIVTPYGSTDGTCRIGSWTSTTDISVSVQCHSGAGTLIDNNFTILVIGQGRVGERWGYAWADQPSAASYSPSASYRATSSNGAVTVTRTGVGNYSWSWVGIGKVGTDTETFMVTAYGGGGGAFCGIGGWSGAPDLTNTIVCRNSAGAAVDMQYNVLVIE